VTDQGLWILDARFTGIDDPGGLGTALDAIPGVLGHGLFVGLARPDVASAQTNAAPATASPRRRGSDRRVARPSGVGR
jgi:ribose 5-phosphate isomerase A